jgi:ribosomal protein S18 acetylase RimI-like enzyme
VLVRPAKLEDAEVLAAIIAEVAHEGTIGPEPPVEIAARAERFRQAIQAQAPNATWVLEENGRTVGYAHSRKATKGVLALEMAILPDGRGHGGGRALIRAVLEHARECAAHKIELEAWVDNARAIALYTSSGFEVEGIRRDHYRRKNGTLRSAMIMARHLGDLEP